MEKNETVFFSIDFDEAVNLRYHDQKITIPYEYIPFIRQQLGQHIAMVEMIRSRNGKDE